MCCLLLGCLVFGGGWLVLFVVCGLALVAVC